MNPRRAPSSAFVLSRAAHMTRGWLQTRVVCDDRCGAGVMAQTGGELQLVVGATGPQMRLIMSMFESVFPPYACARYAPPVLAVRVAAGLSGVVWGTPCVHGHRCQADADRAGAGVSG